MKTKTKVINFFGGPGVGKTTTATGVFTELKKLNINCRYVSEYAAELSDQNNMSLIETQIHVFGQQFTRQWSLIDKVDYIITDSPLLLSSIYYAYYYDKTKQKLFSKEYKQLAIDFYDSTFLEFNNVNFLVERKTEFDTNGRHHDLKESLAIDERIINKMNERGIHYYTTDAYNSVNDVLQILIK